MNSFYDELSLVESNKLIGFFTQGNSSHPDMDKIRFSLFSLFTWHIENDQILACSCREKILC